MRNILYLKAIELQDKLKLKGTGRGEECYEFEFPNDKNILVHLKVIDNKTEISCTCLHSTMNHDALCSYKLSVLFLKFKQTMRRMSKRW